MKLKLFAYRFLSTILGGTMVSSLSFGVNVPSLGGRNKPRKKPFQVIITVDTEAGYVEPSERRVWQMEDPAATQGFIQGVRNLLGIFEKHGIKTTFFLSTNCFAEKNETLKEIKKELKHLHKKGHEIGLHTHPDSDRALQRSLNKSCDATSAFFYTYQEKKDILKKAREIVKRNLGKEISEKMVSFRWGNWALDTEAVKALEQTGFKVDSSATPGIKGHSKDSMKYDWSRASYHYPWKLSKKNYQTQERPFSKVLEIPIATFTFFGKKMRADPVNSLLLNEAFRKYYVNADRSEKPFPFVVITHSSEATTKEGKQTQALKDLEEFISLARTYDDVEFVTMREAATTQ